MRLVPGQRRNAHRKNEIADIPKLLDLLYLKGAIVTGNVTVIRHMAMNLPDRAKQRKSLCVMRK